MKSKAIFQPFNQGALLLFLVALTGLYNEGTASWSPYFRLNLILHPLLGCLAIAWFTWWIFRHLKQLVPELRLSVFFFCSLLLFVSLIRSYVNKHYLLIVSDSLAGTIFILIPIFGFFILLGIKPFIQLLRQNKWIGADIGLLGLWHVNGMLGILILMIGGGRNAMMLFDAHGTIGGLLVAFNLAWYLTPRRFFSPVRKGLPISLAAAAIFLLSIGATVNWVGHRLAALPRYAPVTLNLSTIPLEKRQPPYVDSLPLPIDARWLAITESCGRTAACHPEILVDHQASIHNNSLKTGHFQKNLELLAGEIGAPNQLTCAGCHAPLALFQNGGDVSCYREKDNFSCVFCHLIDRVGFAADGKQSTLGLSVPVDHLSMFIDAEQNGGRLRPLDYWLIRLNPQGHGRVFKRPLYKQDEYCQACHHLQLKPSGTGPTCVQCHMEPRDVLHLKGKMKNHFFPGANTVIPTLLQMESYARLNEDYLQGNFFIYSMGPLYKRPKSTPADLLRDRAGKFVFLTMRIEAATPPRRGQEMEFTVVTKNVGLDHAFPTSALDLSETWLEVKVTDENGRLLFTSGGIDDQQRIQPDAHTMGGYMIGLDGHRVAQNRVWQIKQKVVERNIADQQETRDDYRFVLPADSGRLVNITAQWRYRKLCQEFWAWAYSLEQPIPSPVVVRTFNQFAVNER